MLKKDMPIGIIIYKGPSLIDGKPIVAIANAFRYSANEKTGQMIQVWIIREDIHPQDAKRTHEDFSICGDCKHRDLKSCYVITFRGPTSVYNAYKRGTYIKYTPDCDKFFKDRYIRLGAYGDPAAIPMYIWDRFCSLTKGHTGYTHQWERCNQELKKYCMASVETDSEYAHANSIGWRTFRTRCYITDPIFGNEKICPASGEGGKKLDCSKCCSCEGSESNRKNIVIVAHGLDFKIRYFRAGMIKIRNRQEYRVLPQRKTFEVLV